MSESDDSSLNSVELDAGGVYNGDSDTGLESMSSAETPHKRVSLSCSFCLDGDAGAGEAGAVEVAVARQLEALRQEVTRLKCDKLDLLRQNVVSPHTLPYYPPSRSLPSPVPCRSFPSPTQRRSPIHCRSLPSPALPSPSHVSSPSPNTPCHSPSTSRYIPSPSSSRSLPHNIPAKQD